MSMVLWLSFLAALTTVWVAAWSSAAATAEGADGLAAEIDGPTVVESLGAPLRFTVRITGAGRVRVAVEATEGFEVAGPREFEVAPEGDAPIDRVVELTPGPRVYRAHYALHARAWLLEQPDGEPQAHARHVFEVTDPAIEPAWTDAPLAIAPALPPLPAAAQDAAARREEAMGLARRALAGEVADFAWRLESDAGLFGAAVVPGPAGLVDATIAFASAGGTMAFEGFRIAVDGTPLDSTFGARASFAEGRATIDTPIRAGEGEGVCRVTLFAESGALRVAFSMPRTPRNLQGHPRYTDLALGPADRAARRVYAGMGNVVTGPHDVHLGAGGPHLCTRHVGVEFEGALALLEATDVFPDFFVARTEDRQYGLHTHHDATFTLLPSARGAFAAARAYRAIAGFQPPPDVAWLQGRMCLDQWGGDYAEAAAGIRRAARYGLADSVFVKHSWQRWGYDVRLPEIYPPRGSMEDFLAMAQACREAGILFCPHDNYVDFYPDAEGFSYRHIIFNADGTPQRAWFNRSAQAQSYRWLPTAFFPWMEANLRLMRDNVAPQAYFTDVFSAIAPMDFFDESGRFSPKTVTAERWGAAIDRMREVLHAATISEDAIDAYVGHLAAGQSDHGPATGVDNWFAWRARGASDSERVPWHDMVTHGAFVHFAGGLSDRYVADRPGGGGYGSDDYLSNTVIGGRNPMCDGPFSRRAVMTYWLLHDVCARLARAELLAHEFDGDDIHRQHATFGGGAEVWTNRGATPWTVAGVTLPTNGLLARAGDCEATVALIGEARVGWARSPGAWFFDARPPLPDGVGPRGGWQETQQRRERGEPGPETRLPRQFVDFGEVATDGAFRLLAGDQALRLIPLPQGPGFRVVLRLEALGVPRGAEVGVRALDEGGNERAAPAVTLGEGTLEIAADGDVFEYRLEW